MSNLPIKDANNAARKIDVFLRTEGADTVEVQAVALVNPATGDALAPTPAGAMPISGTVALDAAALAALALAATPATQAVSLDTASLAALENITVGGQVELGSASLAALETITVGGQVELGATSLAALESITAAGPLTDAQLRAAALPISGTVALDAAALAALALAATPATQAVSLDAASLAALENITVGGQVELGSASLAALETITVGGQVELGATSLAALESITAAGPLTDAQLRAAAVPVSATGELIEAIEALRMCVHSLSRSVGMVTVDVGGRLRTVSDTFSVINVNGGSLSTLTTLTTCNTVASLTNQAQVGGFAANDEVPALLRMSAGVLRNNITTS